MLRFVLTHAKSTQQYGKVEGYLNQFSWHRHQVLENGHDLTTGKFRYFHKESVGAQSKRKLTPVENLDAFWRDITHSKEVTSHESKIRSFVKVILNYPIYLAMSGLIVET